MTQNPFTLNFGKTPLTLIDRPQAINKVIDEFDAPLINNQIYVLSGIRGSGKTVTLTEIDKTLSQKDHWIVIELNSSRDLLQALASKLYQSPQLHKLYVDAKINLSFWGITVNFEPSHQISDIEVAIDQLLKVARDRHYRILVSIDEVTNTPAMREFASAFQIFIRQDAPIFLLMTGLYENISDLQNDDNLTFLYRAPKIFLRPLNLTAISNEYQQIFNLPDPEAIKLAKLTKGYPYAFQLLGYLKWEHPELNELDLLNEFDANIQEYVYHKLWSEIMFNDQKVLIAMVKIQGNHAECRIKDLREELHYSSSLMSGCRDRLKKKGLVNTDHYGYLSFTLPRFDRYVEVYHLDD